MAVVEGLCGLEGEGEESGGGEPPAEEAPVPGTAGALDPGVEAG